MFSKIWLGSIGRNVSTADAAAALNMFPKLLDVPISTYLMVLAKMRRPSATPNASTPRSFSSNTTSAASLATSAAVSTEIPTSAACSASASLTPSPKKATDRPVRRNETISRAFCSGEIRAKMVLPRAASSNLASSRASTSAPVIVPLDGNPKSAQTFSATFGLSPVATLSSMPSAASCANESRAAAFGSSANTKNPSSTRPHSSSTVRTVSSGAGLLATATTRRPLLNSPASVACAASGTPSHFCSTCSGAPLTTSTRPPASSTSVEVARRAWSNGSVATRWTLAVDTPTAAGDSHSAVSIALALTPPDAASTSVASRPARSTASSCAPAGSTASTRLMRPSVRVPVLSVIKMSMSPRSSMQTNRLTKTLSRANRRDPVARLVLTTAGSSCGVMPTAIASANNTESMTDRRSNRLVTKMSAVRVSATHSSR